MSTCASSTPFSVSPTVPYAALESPALAAGSAAAPTVSAMSCAVLTTASIDRFALPAAHLASHLDQGEKLRGRMREVMRGIICREGHLTDFRRLPNSTEAVGSVVI